LYIFLSAALIAIAVTSLYLIRSNRRIFARLAALSEQRSDLAQKLISTQESTLRHISRELHDEFGQVLTAIGSLLSRVEKQVPQGAPLRQTCKKCGRSHNRRSIIFGACRKHCIPCCSMNKDSRAPWIGTSQ